MSEITLSATAGADGRLHFDIPAAAGEYEVRVTLTPKVGRRPPEDFERVFGAIPDFSVEPREVDVPENREEF